MNTIGEHDDWRTGPVAVLASGGVESAVLIAELAQRSPAVHPLYVRLGLLWEPVEEAALRTFVALLANPRVAEPRGFDMSIRSVYGDHWSTTGHDTPDHQSPDEAVFLPGRNILLLAQAALWCHLNRVPTIALGPLAGNPFPDCTDEFFTEYQDVLNRAVDGELQIVRPFRSTSTKSCCAARSSRSARRSRAFDRSASCTAAAATNAPSGVVRLRRPDWTI